MLSLHNSLIEQYRKASRSSNEDMTLDRPSNLFSSLAFLLQCFCKNHVGSEDSIHISGHLHLVSGSGRSLSFLISEKYFRLCDEISSSSRCVTNNEDKTQTEGCSFQRKYAYTNKDIECKEDCPYNMKIKQEPSDLSSLSEKMDCNNEKDNNSYLCSSQIEKEPSGSSKLESSGSQILEHYDPSLSNSMQIKQEDSCSFLSVINQDNNTCWTSDFNSAKGFSLTDEQNLTKSKQLESLPNGSLVFGGLLNESHKMDNTQLPILRKPDTLPEQSPLTTATLTGPTLAAPVENSITRVVHYPPQNSSFLSTPVAPSPEPTSTTSKTLGVTTKRLYTDEGYTYSLKYDDKKHGKLYWRCSNMRSKGCPATCSTDYNRENIVYKPTPHSHPPSTKEQLKSQRAKQQVVHNIKVAAISCTGAPSSVYREVIEPVSGEIIEALPLKDSCTHIVRKERKKLIAHKDIHFDARELHAQEYREKPDLLLPKQERLTTYPEPFHLTADKRRQTYKEECFAKE